MEILKELKKVDKSGMGELIYGFPEQCQAASGFSEKTDLSRLGRGWEQIVFTGLGGSALGGDLIRNYISGELRIPVIVNRNYTLPAFVSQRTLLIASSYSGNTEETLSAYRVARKSNAKIIVITTGGELLESARKDKVPFINIPGGFSPRAALGYCFFPILGVLTRLGLIRDKSREVKETVRVLTRMREKSLKPGIPLSKNPAKKLALKLKGHYAIIYGSQDLLDSVVTRWRCQLAENSKALASSHFLPEMNIWGTFPSTCWPKARSASSTMNSSASLLKRRHWC